MHGHRDDRGGRFACCCRRLAAGAHRLVDHTSAEIHNVLQADINGSRGRYNRSTGISRVAEDGPWQGLTTAHKLGHRLDQLGFGQGLQYGSELNTPEMADWWKAIRSSDAYKALEASKTRGTVDGFDPRGNRVTTAIPTERLTYYLKPQELFARSYAEYIALKAAQKGHPELARQLGVALNSFECLRFRTQWTPMDFDPIMKAFDKLFAQKGWLR